MCTYIYRLAWKAHSVFNDITAVGMTSDVSIRQQLNIESSPLRRHRWSSLIPDGSKLERIRRSFSALLPKRRENAKRSQSPANRSRIVLNLETVIQLDFA